MIAIGDCRSDSVAGAIKFNANIDPQVSLQQKSHPAHPGSVQPAQLSHRHAFRRRHVESPKRSDVIDPAKVEWRARWNNDNDPHTADVPIGQPPHHRAGAVIVFSIDFYFFGINE